MGALTAAGTQYLQTQLSFLLLSGNVLPDANSSIFGNVQLRNFLKGKSHTSENVFKAVFCLTFWSEMGAREEHFLRVC